MKKYTLVILAAVLIYSCSSKKVIEKPELEIEKDNVVVEKISTLQFTFEMQKPFTNSSLRGISVVDSLIAWVSGDKGTILRTTDGGKTWQSSKVKGYETLDFRDIEAFDKYSAIIMCIDTPAFFFKTTDGGKSWKRKYMNRNPKIFFNGLAFWDSKNGIAFSDPIDGRFFIVSTKDGGESWKEIPQINIPQVQKNEGGFAASGTSIFVEGKDLVWFGSGGSEKAKIYFSQDAGQNWRTEDAPIKSGNASSGVFSISFKDDLYGVAVGGDYKNDKNKNGNCAITDDGGLSWQSISESNPQGFRSSVAWNPIHKYFLTVGTSGSDYSLDDGKTWNPINTKSYNSIGISRKDGTCFVVGDGGAIAKVITK
ncbi:MAG: oxidoreductase [Ignavibacteria bacterium]|nr:MAG: oxidoreductase [Ignavibacteria bacterium]KAF0161008.1 MAG: oxidoreductase [Ignavibacteria bacterium]